MNKLGFEDGVARIHIPVETNLQVEFRLNGKLLQISEDEAWYLNFNLLRGCRIFFLLRTEKAGFVSCSLTDTAFSK